MPGENAEDGRPICVIDCFEIMIPNILLNKAVDSIYRRFSRKNIKGRIRYYLNIYYRESWKKWSGNEADIISLCYEVWYTTVAHSILHKMFSEFLVQHIKMFCGSYMALCHLDSNDKEWCGRQLKFKRFTKVWENI